MVSTKLMIESIEAKLPQTQCGQCGYSGCAPYAEAIANQQAEINLCPPGGDRTIQALASLLDIPIIPIADPVQSVKPKAIAWIDEDVCIGCMACIKACPVDAILGTTKLMHTVLTNECTGCELCLEPCPVDCIHMQDVDNDFLPKDDYLSHSSIIEPSERAAAHAKSRYTWHTNRLSRDKQERTEYLAQREANLNHQTQATPPKAAFNPLDLLNKAAAKAEKLVDKAVAPSNQTQLVQEKIQDAIDQAAIRQAMKDIELGSESEKQQAIAFLRERKRAERSKKRMKSV